MDKEDLTHVYEEYDSAIRMKYCHLQHHRWILKYHAK